MQLEAELTTPDYKSIFQSSAFFISRTFHFYSAVSSGMSRSVVRIVRRKFQRSRPTRRFDEGNKSSRLRTSRNTIFRKIHPAGRSLNFSDYKSPFLFGLRSTRSSRFCTATSPSECCPFPSYVFIGHSPLFSVRSIDSVCGDSSRAMWPAGQFREAIRRFNDCFVYR